MHDVILARVKTPKGNGEGDAMAAKLHPENWRGFTPDSVESGVPEAVRWATRLKCHDADWGKWHATDGSCTFTACGQVVRLFEVDGSPQHDSVEKVNCRHCLAKLNKT